MNPALRSSREKIAREFAADIGIDEDKREMVISPPEDKEKSEDERESSPPTPAESEDDASVDVEGDGVYIISSTTPFTHLCKFSRMCEIFYVFF